MKSKTLIPDILRRPLSLSMALIVTSACITSLQAAVIQLEIGNNAGAYTGSNAPYAAGTSWNLIPSAADQPALSTVWDNGSTFGTLVVDQGRTVGGDSATAIDWNSQPVGGYSNLAGKGGIFDDSLMRDWIYTGSSETYAIRISGLAVGIYQIFALVGEPDTPTRSSNVSVGVGTSASPIISETDARLTAFSLDNDTNDDSIHDVITWTAGKTFVSHTVSVSGPTDYVTVLVDSNDAFSELNGLQIVSVPEPTSALLGLLGAVGLLRRRR